MQEKPILTAKKPPKSAVVHVNNQADASPRTSQESLSEAINLLSALNVNITMSEIINIKEIVPKTVIGSGKVQEFKDIFAAQKIEAVMLNTQLSPSQQRNLEEIWQIKVLDRTGVILEIFASRAKTKAGRVQVALAQVQYQQSRLVRAWTHLERQRGGTGKTGGPGERQIELDKRDLLDKATNLKRQLKTIQQEHKQQRKAREKNNLPQIALVGYTNAGKSTIFQTLTGQKAGIKNQLFATLDPLIRKLTLPSGREVVLSDTVGFISDLPHELVESFKATLEEVTSADLILQVNDASSSEANAQAEDVRTVLKEINATKILTLQVANKIDLVKNPTSATAGIEISATTGQGIAELLTAIEDKLASTELHKTITLPFSAGKQKAWLYAHAIIKSETVLKDKIKLKLHISQQNWDKYQKAFTQ